MKLCWLLARIASTRAQLESMGAQVSYCGQLGANLN